MSKQAVATRPGPNATGAPQDVPFVVVFQAYPTQKAKYFADICIFANSRLGASLCVALRGTASIGAIQRWLSRASPLLSDAAKQIWFATGPLTLPSPEGSGFHPLPPPGEGPGMRACAGSLMKASYATLLTS